MWRSSPRRGTFVKAFSPPGGFEDPEQIAVDNSGDPVTDPSAGDVYVTDAGRETIDKFSALGAYESQLTEGEVCESEKGVEMVEECGVFPFASLRGIAVDSEGDLWVYQAVEGKTGEKPFFGFVDEFDLTGGLLQAFVTPNFVHEDHGFAVDAKDGLYMVEALDREVFKSAAPAAYIPKAANRLTRVGELRQSGVNLAGVTALAVVPSVNKGLVDGDGVLVDTGSSVVEYGAFGEPYGVPVEVFPGEVVPVGFAGLSGSEGLAVGGSGTVYASEAGADSVQVFDYDSAPTVVTGAPSGVSETGLTLRGSVNPEGEEVKECYFEYGTEAGKYSDRAECEPAAGEGVGHIGKGVAAVSVSAVVSGLAPAEVRSFRLVAVSGPGVLAAGAGLTTSDPVISGEVVSGAGSVGASASAEVDPEGLASCYWLEYGTNVSYGGRIPEGDGCVSVGEGEGPVPVSVGLTGLEPGTGYHFRFVARNALGVRAGGDVAFTTFPVGSAELPDGRAYELVSPAGAGEDTDVYVPGGMMFTLDGTEGAVGATNHGVISARPFAASVDGEAVTYVGDPPVTGGDGSSGDGNGNQFVARRSAGGGWTEVDVNGASYANEYSAFPRDLSVGVVFGGELAGEAPAGALELFSRATVAGAPFQPLTTTVPACGSYIADGNPGGGSPFSGGNAGTGAVPAFSHLLFEARGALLSTPEAPAGCGAGNDLYDSVGGRLYLVNVLPDGNVDAHANFGRTGLSPDGHLEPENSNVISADGSRVYWSAVRTVPVGAEFEERPEALYVRVNDTLPEGEGGECEAGRACTVQVDRAEPGTGASGGGLFWTASSDGSRVLFTDENELTKDSSAEPGVGLDLYEYDLEAPEGERLSDLSVPATAGVHADVQGVVGASEDGSYVYFVADGVLSEGQNAEGTEPVSGKPNLYLRHEGVTTFVATLSAGDDEFEEGGVRDGDWQADAGKRTAEVAPDGRSVTFMSRLALTGYDNMLDGVPLTEVFVYDAGTGRLACASCNPSGEAPVAPTDPEYTANKETVEGMWGSLLPISESHVGYQPRVISDDGGRVFFDSVEPLVSRDSNGYLDVYEWEREGEGSCTAGSASRANGGCVFLLSGGQSPENSYLVDASASGDDAFFVSRAQLVKADRGSDDDELYDARVGGVPAPEEASCAGAGCQGVPPAPPVFATPATATITGVDDLEALPPAPALVKPAAKPAPKKCKKPRRLRHGKCVKPKAKATGKGKATATGKGRAQKAGRVGRVG